MPQPVDPQGRPLFSEWLTAKAPTQVTKAIGEGLGLDVYTPQYSRQVILCHNAYLACERRTYHPSSDAPYSGPRYDVGVN